MQHPFSCLLIDNDEEDQEIFFSALQEVNPDVACSFANNAVEALEMLTQNTDQQPSIIFVDMNMPLMNGLECLQELKKIDRLQKTPVYLYSTFASPENITKAVALGTENYFVKPTSFSQLTALLKNLLMDQ